MNQDDLNCFRGVLETELEEVDAELGLGVLLPHSENTTCSHPAEAASAVEGQMLTVAIRRLLEDRRVLILAALVRIEKGIFGICVNCDEDIERERLEAIPYSPLCIACARATSP